MNTTSTRTAYPAFTYVAPSGVRVDSELGEPRTAGAARIVFACYAYNLRRIAAAFTVHTTDFDTAWSTR